MSEYQNAIDTMMLLAYADEGDRITSSDLAECETAACIIQDQQERIAELEAEVERLQKLLMLANSQLPNDRKKRCRDKAEAMGLYGSSDTAGGG